METIIREPAVSGMFYDNNPDRLKNQIDKMIQDAPDFNIEKLKALISPHAGFIYSGPIAGYGFKQLKNKHFETVFILGPSHQVYVKGASVPVFTHFKTPLGLVEVDTKIVSKLSKQESFISIPEAHAREHSLEVQIPFLQRVLTNFKIVPIIIGEGEHKEIANILKEYISSQTLIIVSTDLSHYLPYQTAVEKDKNSIKWITDGDIDKARFCDACGRNPVLVLMYLSKEMHWSSKVLDYRNSGDTAGDKSRVVGYTSIAYYE